MFFNTLQVTPKNSVIFRIKSLIEETNGSRKLTHVEIFYPYPAECILNMVESEEAYFGISI